MSGLENILYTAALNGIDSSLAVKRAERLLEQVGLTQKIYAKVRPIPGMKQRLGWLIY